MNSIWRLVGLCLVAGSAGGYFAGVVTGIYAAIFVAGLGLVIDSLRK